MIFDDFAFPAVTGFYVSGYVMNTCTSCTTTTAFSYGAHIMHIGMNGAISWEAYPNQDNSYRMQYLDLFKYITPTSTTEWYLFGCGFNAFSRVKVDKANLPVGNFVVT